MIYTKSSFYVGVIAVVLLMSNFINSSKNEANDTRINPLIHSQADSLDYFADNGFGKPVQSIQHPMGEYFKGVTYVAYQGPHEDPYVCSYNHQTKEWKGPFKAGISALGKTPLSTDPDEIDNHGRPALLVDGEGYIHLIFGGHGGHRGLGANTLGTMGRGEQMHVVSKSPYDISEWEQLRNVSPLGTYSQWVKMSNGTIYLFYRHGSHRSNWVYQKSTDNARTFAAPVSILKYKKAEGHAFTSDSWYAWFQEGANNSIVSTFNYHLCGTGENHTSLRLNSYYMKMNTETDTWESIMGKKLDMPLTKESADELVQIYDSKGKSVRLGTIRSDSKGNPHLYFRNNANISYANWESDKWNFNEVLGQKFKFEEADILIANTNEIRFLTSSIMNNTAEIAWWQADENGKNWTKETPLVTSKNGKYVMSSLIRNAHPDARVIVAEIPNTPMAVDSKMYLIGDHGPVKRFGF
ncbi:hypothetical protein EGI22_08010 [Lacihabitans sp. LS3-19]|uniref:BNR-4 repeat-containing protein n=1 Tax=Lacihabitans sp. LS3-19 TaxID=2487335 RepID=UPI0020CEC1C1|nr:BNR-4 repeat-containing protein [Lacihabitans sp. LS3-19]MCP9767854.1 hypothetical protein [Lacihabitans sp. LS3-19]